MILNFKGKIYGRFISSLVFYIQICKEKIIIKNFYKFKLTGKKKNKKYIIYHSGYPGGLKKKLFYKEYKRNKKVFFNSLKRMLPKVLFKKIFKRIKLI